MEELDNVPPDQIKAQPGLAVGDITRCPVSGEVFRIKANSPKVTVAGKDWYLCCRRCTARFESNPQKYTGGR
jgi:YHS domain-containing protein